MGDSASLLSLLVLLATPHAASAFRVGSTPVVARRAESRALARAADGDESDALEAFRRQLQNQMSTPGVSSVSSTGSDDLWASPQDAVDAGTVLLADHTTWCDGSKESKRAPFEQFALRGPLPRDLPPDTLARVLPVVFIVEKRSDGSHVALLLERRTGILLGDIKGDEYAVAPINPLWFGGSATRDKVEVLTQHDGPAAPEGFVAVQPGVSFGPWETARPLIEAGKIMATRSFIFAGKTVFKKGVLEEQIDGGYWKIARVSRDVLFKERSEPSSRPGSKPLWRETMELCDGDYLECCKSLYGEDF